MSRCCFLILIFVSVAVLGCNSSQYPPVSGVVTVEGKAMPHLRVVFSPKSSADSALIGPPSFGVTDEKGRYTLVTKGGEQGAVVGNHAVGFRWDDIPPSSVVSLTQAYNSMKARYPEEAADIKKQLDEVKQKLQDRPELKDNIQLDFVVPAQGTDRANFDL